MLAPVLWLASTIPDNEKGLALYQRCRAATAMCVAYIDGFSDGLEMRGRAICLNGVSLGTVARVYISYMDAHPKMFDEPKSVGLSNALLENYRCSAKGK